MGSQVCYMVWQGVTKSDKNLTLLESTRVQWNVWRSAKYWNFLQIQTWSSPYHTPPTSNKLLIQVAVGVLGGIFICMGYAICITTCAVEVISGAGLELSLQSSSVKVGLRAKWGWSKLRSQPGCNKLVPQGSGCQWVMEGGSSSPYSSYNNTPLLSGFLSSNKLHLEMLILHLWTTYWYY